MCVTIDLHIHISQVGGKRLAIPVPAVQLLMLAFAVAMLLVGAINEMEELAQLGVDKILGSLNTMGLTLAKFLLNFLKGKTFTGIL